MDKHFIMNSARKNNWIESFYPSILKIVDHEKATEDNLNLPTSD